MKWREGEREEKAEDSPYGAKDSPYGAPESHRSYIHLHSSDHTGLVDLGRARDSQMMPMLFQHREYKERCHN